MNEKATPIITVEQLEEALEERVTPDRRQVDMGLPEGVPADRRKRARRSSDVTDG